MKRIILFFFLLLIKENNENGLYKSHAFIFDVDLYSLWVMRLLILIKYIHRYTVLPYTWILFEMKINSKVIIQRPCLNAIMSFHAWHFVFLICNLNRKFMIQMYKNLSRIFKFCVGRLIYSINATYELFQNFKSKIIFLSQTGEKNVWKIPQAKIHSLSEIT